MASNKNTKEALRCEAEKDFYLENIKRLQNQVQSDLNTWSVPIIDERLAKLQRDFKSLETKVKQIVCGEFTEEAKNAAQSDLNESESLMFDLIGRLKMQCQVLQAEATTSEQSNVKEVEPNASNNVAEKRSESSVQNNAVEHFVVMKFAGRIEEVNGSTELS